ncbi:MAG: helix-turn-helix domain-containing protein [Hydrogenoanaerobacterium sp.]
MSKVVYSGSLFSDRSMPKNDLSLQSREDVQSLVRLEAGLLMDKYGACLDVPQLCEALKVGRSNVYELLKSGKLPVKIIGRRKIVSVADLAWYLVAVESSQFSS